MTKKIVIVRCVKEKYLPSICHDYREVVAYDDFIEYLFSTWKYMNNELLRRLERRDRHERSSLKSIKDIQYHKMDYIKETSQPILHYQ